MVKSIVVFTLYTCPTGFLKTVVALPLHITCVRNFVVRALYSMTGKTLHIDSLILSSTNVIGRRDTQKYNIMWLLLLLLLTLILLFIAVGCFYGFWCFVLPADNNSKIAADEIPFVAPTGTETDGGDSDLHLSDGSVGQGGRCAGCLSKEQVGELVDRRLTVMLAQQNLVDFHSDLTQLRQELEGWARRLVMSELNSYRLVVNEQLENDRIHNTDRHSSLVELQSSLVAKLDHLKSQVEGLLDKSSWHTEHIQSLTDKLSSQSLSRDEEAVVRLRLQTDMNRLDVDVEQLKADYSSLLHRTQSEQQTPDINSAIRDYLTAVFSDDKGGTAAGALVDTDTKAALVAWLRSEYVSHQDLEAKLEMLAQHISEKINTRLKEVELAAAAAAAEAAIIGSKSTKDKSVVDSENAEAAATAAVDGSVYASRENCTLSGTTLVTPEKVLEMIQQQLNIYDADKTGKVDYALESAGGSIISIRCSETYQQRTAQLTVFGIPLWYTSNSPRVVIQPGVQPGECWAFAGSTGYLVIQLSALIRITSVTIEHTPLSLTPRNSIDSAPKEFSVWGLANENDMEGVKLGEFTYKSIKDKPLQTFDIDNSKKDLRFQFVELKIHSNHGHPEFTCLYRFRVHGTTS
jgi:SUN domain-containing protein 1/2